MIISRSLDKSLDYPLDIALDYPLDTLAEVNEVASVLERVGGLNPLLVTDPALIDPANAGRPIMQGRALSGDGNTQYVDCEVVTIPANATWQAEVFMRLDLGFNFTLPFGDNQWEAGFGVIFYHGGAVRMFSKDSSLATQEPSGVIAGQWFKCVYGFDGAEGYVDIDDVRVYTTALSNQESSLSTNLKILGGGNLSEKACSVAYAKLEINGNLHAEYTLEEGSGIIAYDSSGNGNHGTLVNSPVRITSEDVGACYANERGFTDSSGVIIPALKEDSSTDAQGNPTQWRDSVYPVPFAKRQSFAREFDGLTQAITIDGLDAADTVVSSFGTATPSISAGVVNFTAGWCAELVLSSGSIYPLAEGGGAVAYDSSGNGNHGSYVNAPAVITQDVSHSNLERGFTESGGVKIPAINSTTDALGNPLTNPPLATGHNGAETLLSAKVAEDGDYPPAIKAALAMPDWTHGDALTAPLYGDAAANSADKILLLPAPASGDALDTINDYHA